MAVSINMNGSRTVGRIEAKYVFLGSQMQTDMYVSCDAEDVKELGKKLEKIFGESVVLYYGIPGQSAISSSTISKAMSMAEKHGSINVYVVSSDAMRDVPLTRGLMAFFSSIPIVNNVVEICELSAKQVERMRNAWLP